MWSAFAAIQNFKQAEKFLKQIRVKMTPAQVDKAEVLAREYEAKNYKGWL
jgi:hypothetical protein